MGRMKNIRLKLYGADESSWEIIKAETGSYAANPAKCLASSESNIKKELSLSKVERHLSLSEKE